MDKAVTMEQALESVRKCQEELEGKQDALTGTPGQVVGFDVKGRAVAVDNQVGDIAAILDALNGEVV